LVNILDTSKYNIVKEIKKAKAKDKEEKK